MKYGTGFLVIGLSVSTAAWSGNIASVPHTFAAGAAASASDVNENFEALRTQIDGNANDVSDVNTKADANAASIAAINEPKEYTEYYNGSTFQIVFDRPNVYRAGSGSYMYRTTDGPLSLNHELRLPQGAVVSDLRCYYIDNDPVKNIEFLGQQIIRLTTGTNIDSYFTDSVTTSSQSPLIRTFVSPEESLTIDNANYAYKINITDDNFPSGAGVARFHGCSVTYTK